MKLHLFSIGPTSAPRESERNHDLMYTAVFVIGAPAVVIGSMYLVDAVFQLVWR